MFLNQHYPFIKTVITILTAVILSACSSGLLYTTQHEEIHEIGEQITDFNMPQGYHEQFALDTAGYQVVSLEGPTSACHIYLVQAPSNIQIDIETMQKKADDLNQNNTPIRKTMEVVEQRTALIRGETVNVLVSEGVNADHQRYRQINALFTGKTGPALVNLSTPVDHWDWELVEGFITSLK